MCKNKRLYYNKDGYKWSWTHDPDWSRYYTTNSEGEGLFIVDLKRNERQQILGTCQFSLRELKDHKRSIRKYMTETMMYILND